MRNILNLLFGELVEVILLVKFVEQLSKQVTARKIFLEVSYFLDISNKY